MLAESFALETWSVQAMKRIKTHIVKVGKRPLFALAFMFAPMDLIAINLMILHATT